jgi:hypothetical protein
MVKEEVGELEVSLEEIVEVLRVPYLFSDIGNGKLTLERSAKKKFPVVKKEYNNSLKRVINSPKNKLPFVFRSFINKYNDIFGKDVYTILNELDNESIAYVIGSLEFEENIRKYSPFVWINPLGLEN